MFAASRTARVPGRIIFLILSINTINGIKTEGVPWGTKCANICWVWLNHPNTIRVIQRGRDKANVITIWLDLVNTYGNSPRKLLNKIKANTLTNKVDTPICEGVKRALNSLCRVIVILLHSNDQREGETQ